MRDEIKELVGVVRYQQKEIEELKAIKESPDRTQKMLSRVEQEYIESKLREQHGNRAQFKEESDTSNKAPRKWTKWQYIGAGLALATAFTGGYWVYAVYTANAAAAAATAAAAETVAATTALVEAEAAWAASTYVTWISAALGDVFGATLGAVNTMAASGAVTAAEATLSAAVAAEASAVSLAATTAATSQTAATVFGTTSAVSGATFVGHKMKNRKRR